MQPRGLSNNNAETVLGLLNLLGTLVWMDQPELRNLVLLNPCRVAVAMASLMTICFGQENFEHRDMMMIERKITEHRSDLLRFQSTGIATRKLIRGLWERGPQGPSAFKPCVLCCTMVNINWETAASYSSKQAG